MDSGTYKRCEFIIRQFMAVENPTSELLAMFHEWFFNGCHCREKTLIIRRLFYGALSDVIPRQPDPELTSEPKYKAI